MSQQISRQTTSSGEFATLSDTGGTVTTRCSKRPSGKSSRLERRLLRGLLRAVGDPPLEILLWDQEASPPGSGSAVARVRIGSRKTLWRLAIDPLYEFGQAYASGDLLVDGDLAGLMRIGKETGVKAVRLIPPITSGKWIHDSSVRLSPEDAEQIQSRLDPSIAFGH